MIFEGDEAFGFSVRDVWNALHDVAILKKALPGCKTLVPTGDNSYAVTLSLGVAAVRGEYAGTVKVMDDQPLAHYIIEGDGKGAPGFVRLRMDCWFEGQPAGTLMRWRCDATVGGLIASIGGKALSGVSKYMAQQFFRTFKQELRSTATPTGEESMIVRAPSRAAAPAGGSVDGRAHGAQPGWLARLWAALLRRFQAR